MLMSVWRTLTTVLRTASTLLAATSVTVMMDTLWTLMTCTPAMVYIENQIQISVVFLKHKRAARTGDGVS